MLHNSYVAILLHAYIYPKILSIVYIWIYNFKSYIKIVNIVNMVQLLALFYVIKIFIYIK